MSTPMTPNAAAGPDDFREQLSAWRDGALPDEASRFVLKRLLQDDALRAEVGRWQVIGDALRAQPQRQPSNDIAARVASAIDASSVAPRQSARRPAMRWMASAAAVGLAAVLMWPSAPEPGGEAASALVASAPVTASSPALATSTPNVATARIASSPIPTPARSAPVLVASNRDLPVPLRIVDGAEADTLVARVPPLVRAPQPTPEQLAPLPAVDAQSRPWPRSAQGQGAYTVEYAAPAAAPPRQ